MRTIGVTKLRDWDFTRREGGVVFAPAKDGHFIYRSKDFRKIVPGARHDAAALERCAATNSVALTAYLAGLASNGVRKVVLPKATIRLSATQMVLLPSRTTPDFGGGKFKVNALSALGGMPIRLFRTEDAHLVNGTLEGQYFEYDYENCGSKPSPLAARMTSPFNALQQSSTTSRTTLRFQPVSRGLTSPRRSGRSCRDTTRTAAPRRFSTRFRSTWSPSPTVGRRRLSPSMIPSGSPTPSRT